MTRPEISTTRIADGGLRVLNETTGAFFALNESAALIYETLRRGGSIDDAAAQLRAHYEIDEPTARQDAARFASELAHHGLVPQ